MNSYMHVYMWSRYNSVSVATVYELDAHGSILERRNIFFSTPQCTAQFWGPSSLLPNGIRPVSQVVKRPGSEADHSSLSIAQVKKVGAIRPLTHTSSLRSV
jgi:hypothetical protein